MSDMNSNYEVVKDKVIAYLSISPKLPHEICKHCGYNSPPSFKRDYLAKMEQAGLIEKVAGSSRYQLKGQKATQKTIIQDLTSDDDFYRTDVIKSWRIRNNSKNIEKHIQLFRSMCRGTLVKHGSNTPLPFKINPDAWTHPQDTTRIVETLKKYYGFDELTHSHRMALRYALQYGMKITLTQAESEALGISGKTDKPELSTLHISDSQVESVLKDSDIDSYHKNLFFFSYATFFRPSTRYIAKVDDLQFYDREVRYVQLDDGRKITNTEALEALSKNYTIQVFKHRAATVQNTKEFKTMQVYPKYVWHDTFVTEFEKFTLSRKHRGFKYLFWDDNHTVFDKNNYNSVVARPRGKDNSYFTQMLFKYGFKEGDFGKQNDSNYAIRHFGVQKWLRMTNYNYGLIMALGWEDINTLIKWYGKRTSSEMAKAFSEVLF